MIRSTAANLTQNRKVANQRNERVEYRVTGGGWGIAVVAQRIRDRRD
jgi:hypothetical protein